jgi:hypothetical protein
MTACLHPCPTCGRHIHGGEHECPFCQTAVPPGFGRCTQPAGGGRPLSRAAVLFVGATAAASCGGIAGGSDSDGGSIGVLYGPAPIRDSGSTDASPDSGPTDAAQDANDDQLLVLYGPAPVDSGPDLDAAPDEGSDAAEKG